MATVAVRVRDPAGEYWAQLVDPVALVGEVAGVVAERIGLPAKLNYELVPEGSAVPLPAAQPLGDAGVTAGSTLVLRPIRDGFFAEFTRELYEEALSNAIEQAWDEAKERLEALYQVDPGYPDKHQLWKRINAGKEPPVAQPAAQPFPPSGAEAVARSTVASATAKVVTTAARRSVAGTFFGAFVTLVAVVVIGGGALIYFDQIPRPDWLPSWFPRQFPSFDSTTVVNGVAVGTGDVRVTLTWDTPADLDLYVTDPRGEEISYLHRSSASGGELDVDANAGCAGGSRVENVFWPTGGAPSGTYRISVVPYSDCGAGSTAYQVAVYVNGALVNRHSGTVSASTGTVRLPDFRR